MIRAAILLVALLAICLAYLATDHASPSRVETTATTTSWAQQSIPELPPDFSRYVKGVEDAKRNARSGPLKRPQHAAGATGEVPDLIRSVFARFGAVVAEQAVRVAKCESGFKPTARLGPNVGVFQMNGQYHRARAARLGFTWEQIASEAVPNITLAADLYADSGWGPWSCRWAA